MFSGTPFGLSCFYSSALSPSVAIGEYPSSYLVRHRPLHVWRNASVMALGVRHGSGRCPPWFALRAVVSSGAWAPVGPFRNWDCIFIVVFSTRADKKTTIKNTIILYAVLPPCRFCRFSYFDLPIVRLADVSICRLAHTVRFAQLLRYCCGVVPIFYYLRCINLKSSIMKIKWGMMMTDGRGKLGGQVASKNRSGAYVRTKVTPVNPRTSAQSAVRQNLAIVSKNWDLLSEKLRNSWNAAADSGDWNRNDIFGDSRKPTGKNLFTSINLVSFRVNNVGILDVPRKASFAVSNASAFTAIIGDIPNHASVNLVVQVSGDVTIGTRFEVQATPPVSAGRFYFENEYRFISATNAVTEGANTLNLGAQWGDKFGEVSEEQIGKKIAVRYRQVLNGQVTPWQSAVAILEA